ncbi:Type III restriction-modification system EcoPI enzyme res (fragment) [Capnocytophaga canimorsus]|uniref:Type III restriction-modification system EcoPI enzyme res n=1 Tax=Capnocytophaga canimorsus TaxID=28188 RepID=A0A0B7IQX3_9FLAO
MKLNFEKNLKHQDKAVQSTIALFESVPIIYPEDINQKYINPKLDYVHYKYRSSSHRIKTENGIQEKTDTSSKVIDIMMETGTGKTYTYTKTLFELNKLYGIFKFIIIVPTLSIKAGTISFLTSESARQHFREQYGKYIELYVVESQNTKKNKKNCFPSSVSSFVSAGSYQSDIIQVLVINAGMLNSDTMVKRFDVQIFDKYNIPFEALSSVKPVVIIDEPHKFSQGNKSWENIQKLKPQFILRYGATFPEKEVIIKKIGNKREKIRVKDYHNLIYQLTAVDAFNQNLVKGVIGHVTEFKNGENTTARLVDTNGKECKMGTCFFQ